MSKVMIHGPVGRLEGRFLPGPGADAPAALILHPHPQYGGTMDNKVVFALHRALHHFGFSTLRLNFRGVGQSQGGYGGGDGEVADAEAAFDWLVHRAPDAARRWVVGYSFGAWIGLRLLARRPVIERFIAVAPPVSLFDFGFLRPCPVPGLIIHGRDDELVPEHDVAELALGLAECDVEYQRIDGACHFFTDSMPELTRHLDGYIGGALADARR